MYLDADGNVDQGRRARRGHLAVGVPGTVAGLEYALREVRHDEARATLIAPAIALAEQRLRARAGRRRHARARRPRTSSEDPAIGRDLPRTTASRSSAGERLVQKDLAQHAARDREQRRRRLLQGPGRRARSSRRARPASGILTQADLDQLHRRASSRRSSATTAAITSSRRRRRARAASIICEILNILEGYPLKELGFRSAQAVHVPDRGDAPRLRRPQQLPRRSRTS